MLPGTMRSLVFRSHEIYGQEHHYGSIYRLNGPGESRSASKKSLALSDNSIGKHVQASQSRIPGKESNDSESNPVAFP